ncbi:hypothetical protein [uncultured Roseibium sp.]|uniref:hypothetical protein n=1 Tax=uncultured Roseibium sp. TaxID=1936171 RepID=UPI0026266E72|nr:hypothetical protein [uncultured Roseibium sp.]
MHFGEHEKSTLLCGCASLKKLTISRRSLLMGGAAATFSAQFPLRANAQSISTDLGGRFASQSELASYVAELQNERSVIMLANDDFLLQHCRRIADGLEVSITAGTSVVADMRTANDDAAFGAYVAGSGAIISGLSLALTTYALVGTAPVWVPALGVGLTVIGGAATFGLALGVKEIDGYGRATTVASFTSGRMSLFAGAPGLATRLGIVGAVAGALIDGYSAFGATRNWSKAADSLAIAVANLEMLQREYARYAGDPNACRQARIEDIDATLKVLGALAGVPIRLE